MPHLKFSLSHILSATAVVALALWAFAPSSQINIKIMPDNSLRLNSEIFPSEQKFWNAFGQRVEYNRSWGRETNVQIAYPRTINHTQVISVVLSISPYGVEIRNPVGYDPISGKILRE